MGYVNHNIKLGCAITMFQKDDHIFRITVTRKKKKKKKKKIQRAEKPPSFVTPFNNTYVIYHQCTMIICMTVSWCNNLLLGNKLKQILIKNGSGLFVSLNCLLLLLLNPNGL